MLIAYNDASGNLVVECAVPGRDAEDIHIETTEGPGLVINVDVKAQTPGSLLARPLQYQVNKVAPEFSVENVHAMCKHGLLTLVFPRKPRPQQSSGFNMAALLRQQRFGMN
jgi:HSP20 family molecular chaperone IbpA